MLVVLCLTKVATDALVLPIISMRLQLYRGGRLALTRLFEAGAGILKSCGMESADTVLYVL